MTTGQILKAARKKAGFTQAELAAKLNIPYQSISQWERDLRQPKAETLEKIAEALGISPLDLGVIRYEKHYQYDPTAYQKIIDAINVAMKATNKSYKSEVFDFDNSESEFLCSRLFECFSNLNPAGQQKAVESVEIIAGNPDYQKEKKNPAEGD
ncbi:helix-turn-helix domain-containing protein [uncultured Dysosmobacter sp.]|uniref:helix-turn-helix domain-containing protein n=1 Tax=uncultured Dysosmobacter sp. TaxID=2591384 RepID=UPI002670EFE2|nr:helix-turn-helix transcriptional regulator [uncultured Dysosmobacter sp.]